MRIIGTGSRSWADRATPREALIRVTAGVSPQDVTVVHGAQGRRDRRGRVVKGFDLICEEVARELGMLTEAHPADWPTCVADCPPYHRKIRWDGVEYCPDAGFRRNGEMVALGADICLGFPLGASPGTRDCMRKARAAGIRVVDWTARKDTELCLW